MEIEEQNIEEQDKPVEGEVSEKEAFADWVKPPTVKDLRADLFEATSAHDGHVSNVDGWLSNLNVTGKAKVKAKPGRSTIVPKLIRKQAEWRYAALSEPFLSTDEMFNVTPITFEDKRSAVQNALVLNNQFNTKIDRF